MNIRSITIISISCIVLVLPLGIVCALPLTYVSDLISTSAPTATASHTIQFTVTQAIPASGRIIITLQAGAFSIPAGLDYTDVDIAVATSGPYVDRALGSAASATDDEVAVVTGSSGSIMFTLNSTSGMAAGDRVQIRIGANAVWGAMGDRSISNPVAQSSYRIQIGTFDPSVAAIDTGIAMIAVVNQVTLMGSPTPVAPVISNGLPSGSIAAGSAAIELSLDTNILAHCRYATSSGVAYASMVKDFSPTTGTTFYTTVYGHQDNTAYTYYVRCAELQGVANTDDYQISFTLADAPAVTTSGGGTGNGIVGSGGSGAYPNGSAFLYLASVTLSGSSTPQSTVTVLTNGTRGVSTQAKTDGTFRITIAGLERGVYTFQVYAVDSASRKSESFSSTLTLGSASVNTISDIKLKFGESTSSATSTPTSITGGRVDFNGDNKINLVDFSILLSSWGKNNPDVDLNKDGTVNLADFSILLFNWTG